VIVDRPLAGPRVLVTGASGFLGGHLCDRLVREQAEVHAVSRSRRADPERAVQWHRAQLENLEDARRVLRSARPELAFHLAGPVGGDPVMQAVLPTFRSLLESSVNMLLASTELGVGRLVLPGSLTEPEAGPTDVSPASPYAAAKWAATSYARMFHALYHSPVVIVRPSMTYGPRQPDGRLLAYVIRSLLAGEGPRLTSGHFEADWTYVDDMIDGFLAAALTPRIEGHTLDLGTGTTATARQVVEMVVDLMRSEIRPSFGALPDRPRDRSRRADAEATWALVGWRASTTLRDGLRRTIDWFASER